MGGYKVQTHRVLEVAGARYTVKPDPPGVGATDAVPGVALEYFDGTGHVSVHIPVDVVRDLLGMINDCSIEITGRTSP